MKNVNHFVTDPFLFDTGRGKGASLTTLLGLIYHLFMTIVEISPSFSSSEEGAAGAGEGASAFAAAFALASASALALASAAAFSSAIRCCSARVRYTLYLGLEDTRALISKRRFQGKSADTVAGLRPIFFLQIPGFLQSFLP